MVLGSDYTRLTFPQKERKQLITPFFQKLAHVTFIGILESIAAVLVGFGGFVAMGFLFLRAHSQDELEKVGSEDADKVRYVFCFSIWLGYWQLAFYVVAMARVRSKTECKKIGWRRSGGVLLVWGCRLTD